MHTSSDTSQRQVRASAPPVAKYLERQAGGREGTEWRTRTRKEREKRREGGKDGDAMEIMYGSRMGGKEK